MNPDSLNGDLIHLDGSLGEGGGQILRSALSLSVVTGRSFRITGIRAGRPRPGLMRQHLACVQAAAQVGAARVEGMSLGSTGLTFVPGGTVAGYHEFRIGSAGSTLLLFQTILPPLLLADRPSEIVLEGGTHNPFAPPFPFIAHAFLPLLRRMGFQVSARLDRAGFHPNGGGSCRFGIEPAGPPSRPEVCLSAGDGIDETKLSAQVCVAGLSRAIAERELEVVRTRLCIPPDRCEIDECPGALGPGNSVHVRVDRAGSSEVFTSFGSPRLRSDEVGRRVADDVAAFLASGASVGGFLADQLLLPLAIGRGGRFVTVTPSLHTRTQAQVIREFLGTEISMEPDGSGRWRIEVEGRKTS